MTQRSLRQQLLYSVTGFSLLLCVLLGAAAYHIALEETQEILDKEMQDMAYFLAKTPIDNLTPRFKPHHHYDEKDLFIDVWRDLGNGSHNTANSAHAQDSYITQIRLPRASAAQFRHINTALGEFKVFVLPLEQRQIQISQPISARQHLAGELALAMLTPYILLMPLFLLILLWLLRHNLSTTKDLQYTLASRAHHDLSPISTLRLPLEISPAIDELNQLFQRIEHAQQQQQQFIADAAHELRSPLTALNLQLKVLQKTLPADLAKTQNFINLNDGLHRLQHLVTQMMALAHQDAHVVQPTAQLDVIEQLTLVVEQLMQPARKKNIDLGLTQQLSFHCYVHATHAQLHSILFNLIDNAIKYTPAHGAIDISVQQLAHTVCICIEDSGAGVAVEDHTKLTQRFVRLSNKHDAVGSGLGLSIVNTAVTQLNGQLGFARSALHGGLAVSVQLPLAVTPNTPPDSIKH